MLHTMSRIEGSHGHNAEGVVKAKYLGKFLLSTGGVKETVQYRRNKGWGKVAQILGMQGEVDMGEIG